MGPGAGMLTAEELCALVDDGRVDTVLLAMTDMQGRLQGKRLAAQYFVDEVMMHGSGACSYILATDVEMNTVGGFALTSWERGYGDVVLHPDLTTLRLVPWLAGTALVLCDVAGEDGSPVSPSPRQVLDGQLTRLAAHGYQAYAGTELEFLVFRDNYETARHKGYRDLEPANQYNVDYSLLGTARVEPLLRRIRNDMAAAGLYPESAKGETNLGHHEINFKYSKARNACDEHVIFKNGAKEIAAQEDLSLTFMAKYDQRDGNSCHIHLSLRTPDGQPVLAGNGEHGFSQVMEHFLAGQLACLPELTLLFAPNINSYKRYVPGSFAPTTVGWGRDNRTCALRIVGHGTSLRMENRVPGGDVNPYLALSAMIAAGLYGLDRELPLEPAVDGNAYATDKPQVPRTLHEATAAFAESKLAREALGDEVVDHYLNAARVELAAYNAAVTDWERTRGFERL